jgi:hypothetical protein
VLELEMNMHVSEELERGHHEHRPYWKRAHHDWRFWVALVLMLAAMFIYLMTDDLSFVPRIRTRPAQSGNVGGSGTR